MATEVKTAGIGNTSHADYQKSSDRTGVSGVADSGHQDRRDLGDKVSDKADDFAHKAKEAGETMKEKASHVGHSMQEAGHNIAEKSKHGHQAICSFTRENPTAAVLMAFGIGAILARILPKW